MIYQTCRHCGKKIHFFGGVSKLVKGWMDDEKWFICFPTDPELLAWSKREPSPYHEPLISLEEAIAGLQFIEADLRT